MEKDINKGSELNPEGELRAAYQRYINQATSLPGNPPTLDESEESSSIIPYELWLLARKIDTEASKKTKA